MDFNNLTLELIIAVLALFVSVFVAYATYIQAKKAEDAIEQQIGLYQADTVLHFTQAYFQIMEQHDELSEYMMIAEDDSELSTFLANTEQINKYWALHSSEFYFFHHGVIPKLMYALWMVDMVDLYSRNKRAWELHEEFLNRYQILYPKMKDFFSKISDISKTASRDTRHRDVRRYVETWIEENRENII